MKPVLLVAADRSRSVLSTASVLLLGANADRVWAGFTNTGVNNIFVQLGADAVLNEGLLVVPQGYFSIDVNQPWLGEVFAIAATAATVLSGVEVSKKP